MGIPSEKKGQPNAPSHLSAISLGFQTSHWKLLSLRVRVFGIKLTPAAISSCRRIPKLVSLEIAASTATRKVKDILLHLKSPDLQGGVGRRGTEGFLWPSSPHVQV